LRDCLFSHTGWKGREIGRKEWVIVKQQLSYVGKEVPRIPDETSEVETVAEREREGGWGGAEI